MFLNSPTRNKTLKKAPIPPFFQSKSRRLPPMFMGRNIAHYQVISTLLMHHDMQPLSGTYSWTICHVITF